MLTGKIIDAREARSAVGTERGPAGMRRLPAAAAERLQSLIDEQNDVTAAVRSLRDEEREAKAVLDRLESDLEIQLAAEGRQIGPDKSVSQYRQHDRDAGAADLERIQNRRARLTDRRSHLTRNLTEWLGRVPAGAEIAMHPEPVPSLKIGQSFSKAIEAQRDRLAELRADLHRVRSAPTPSATVKARARAQIEALAEAGRPDALRSIERGAALKWPETVITADVIGVVAGAAIVPVHNSVAILAWLLKDQMLARVEAEIDDLADDQGALDDDEKLKREREIRAASLAAERAECDLIWQAAAAGSQLAFRVDAAPEAVLGVVLGDSGSGQAEVKDRAQSLLTRVSGALLGRQSAPGAAAV